MFCRLGSERYDPADLEHLCLAGVITLGAVTKRVERGGGQRAAARGAVAELGGSWRRGVTRRSRFCCARISVRFWSRWRSVSRTSRHSHRWRWKSLAFSSATALRFSMISRAAPSLEDQGRRGFVAVVRAGSRHGRWDCRAQSSSDAGAQTGRAAAHIADHFGREQPGAIYASGPLVVVAQSQRG